MFVFGTAENGPTKRRITDVLPNPPWVKLIALLTLQKKSRVKRKSRAEKYIFALSKMHFRTEKCIFGLKMHFRTEKYMFA